MAMSFESADLITLFVTASIPLSLILLTETLKATGQLSTLAARKFLHCVTGLVFMATWPLYSSNQSARYVAALLPALMTLRFMLAGLGITYEPRLVAGTARTGQREELLAGPTLYGLAHVLLTVIAWRNNPPAAAGLAALCAGDGLADVLGRRWGNRGPLAGTLPHNRDKTWVGTATCFLAGFAATAAYVLLFNYLGYYNHFCSSQGPHWSCAKAGKQHLAIGPILLGSAVSAGAAALVETMPGHDNLTVPAVAAAAIWLLL